MATKADLLVASRDSFFVLCTFLHLSGWAAKKHALVPEELEISDATVGMSGFSNRVPFRLTIHKLKQISAFSTERLPQKSS